MKITKKNEEGQRNEQESKQGAEKLIQRQEASHAAREMAPWFLFLFLLSYFFLPSL